MEKQRFPITHFEIISRLLLLKIPDFFKNKEQDFTKVRQQFLQVPRDKTNAGKINDHKEILKFMERYHVNRLKKLEGLESIKQMKNNGRAVKDLAYMASMGEEELAKEIDGNSVDVFIPKLFSFMHKFNSCGKKVFRIEEHLTDELILTDCSNVDSAFLQLPFQTVCFHIPFNKVIRIQKELVEWVYISEEQKEDGRHIKVFYVSRNEDYFTHDFIFNEGDIVAQIEKQISETYKESKLAQEENAEIFSFIVATILYINSHEADKQDVLPSVMFPKKDSRLPVCSVGRNIKINKDLAGCSVNSSGIKSERMMFVLKWTVRGHFRNQKIGHGRLETKRIWIRPFLKGKERKNEEISAKPTVYNVE